MEDVKPMQEMESSPATDAMESAVRQALTHMLAEEGNPLVMAIERAVKKALGQG